MASSWKLPLSGAASSPVLLVALVAAVIVVPCLQMQACTAADAPAPAPAPAPASGPAICTPQQQDLLDKINAFDWRKRCALRNLTGIELSGDCDKNRIEPAFGIFTEQDAHVALVRAYQLVSRCLTSRLLAQAFPDRQAPCMCTFKKALKRNGHNQEISYEFDVSIRSLISEADPGFVC